MAARLYVNIYIYIYIDIIIYTALTAWTADASIAAFHTNEEFKLNSSTSHCDKLDHVTSDWWYI